MSAFYESVISGLRSRKRSSIGLRMTPMVDIIFLLLTFFVLTAKFQEQEKKLPIFLSKAQDQTVAEHKPLAIYLESRDGQSWIRIQNTPAVPVAQADPVEALLLFTQTLQNTLQTATYPAIEIYCDDAIAWDQVVKVYDVIYASGCDNITFRYQE